MKKKQLLGIIRHLLTFGGGFLVAKGTIDADLASQLTAAALTIIGGIWSVTAPEKK
jgi:hypothetical protein